MISSLIAYIPVINRQYLDWLKKYSMYPLFLVRSSEAESLYPKLNRNLIALSDEEVIQLLRSRFPYRKIEYFDPNVIDGCGYYFLPDEEISHIFASKYLNGQKINFDLIHARWDMSAVKRSQPVIPDCKISIGQSDISRILETYKVAKISPDWWRQIGVLIFKQGELLVSVYNNHYPNSLEVSIYGDLRLNFDAGDIAATDYYISLHAERAAISLCARRGIAIEGTSMYINTFPCADCARWIVEAGISKLYFVEGSSFLKGFETLKVSDVEIIQVKIPEFV